MFSVHEQTTRISADLLDKQVCAKHHHAKHRMRTRVLSAVKGALRFCG